MDDTLHGTRNQRGEWTPNRRASYGPLFDWPTRPARIGSWFVRNYLLSWNLLYAVVAIAAYFLATPSSTTR